MIGKLQGIVDYIDNDSIILMAGPVGYRVYTAENLTAGANVCLWIETIVREDSIRLFGFSSPAAQNLFNMLIGVSSVGPRVAMSIMGTIKSDTLMTAIATGDAKTISTAPGVGKKMAEKIIVELKNRVGGASLNFGDMATGGALPDLLSALESLGYRRMDIIDMAQRLVSQNPTADVSKLVPMALKEISGNK
ncbi:MAG: Holliday junction branch migration protein RuvA [Alphaproteobacteria bacterium]|nr:Holliday junction branch migration protein RuvA [Alphaproteobacteria bacterium]